jgi:hypothetical protein
LHGERGDAGAADRGQKGENFRLGHRRRARALGNARAGSHQLDRRNRLDQEIANAHLQQRARHAPIESLRDDDHRRPGSDARHQPLERRHFFLPIGIQIDDDDRGTRNVEISINGRERAGDHTQGDLIAGAEGLTRLLLEPRVGGQHHHPGLARGII